MKSFLKLANLRRNKRHASRAFSFIFLFSAIFAVSIGFFGISHAAQFPRNLTIGDSGGDVSALQSILISQGFLSRPAPTGYFGPITAVALAQWQATAGLPNTGYFGPRSRAKLGGYTPSVATNTNVAATPPPTAPSAPITQTENSSGPASETFSRNLTIGDSGDDVSALQSTLISSGFLSIPAPTGYFGPITSAALAAWQANTGLPSTGYFGPLSRNEIITDSSSTEIADGTSNTDNNTADTGTTDITDATDNNSSTQTTPTSTEPISVPVEFTSGGGGGGGGGGSYTPPPAPPADTTPPTVSIVSPGDGDTVSSSVAIVAISSDDVGIAKVEFYVDGGIQSSVTSAPYTWNWDTTASINGTHTIEAIAYDTSNNTATSNITITVNDPDVTPPTVSITSPAASSSVTNTITITANATDDVGVTTVKFYLDSALEKTATSSPYSFGFDTTSIATGTHALSAQAYDAAGNVGSSGSSSIIVVRPDPTTPSGLAVTGTGTSTVSLSWSASTELGGTISGYTLYRGNTQIGTTTETTYKDTGLVASTTYNYTISSYDNAHNNSPTSSAVNATTKSGSLNYSYGLSVDESLLGLDSSTLATKLNDITSLGIGWLRFDIQWDHVQPNNSSTYNWSYIDPFVTAATARNIKLLGILDYTPTWARTADCENAVGTDRCPPASATDYANFTRAVVSHFSSEISDWEIWNEPNLGSNWEPVADASAYTTLLNSAYAAIKAQSPSALVITGGMAPSANTLSSIAPLTFLSDIYADGGQGSFDAVGFHPYSYPTMPDNFYPWNAWSQMANTTTSLRGIMTANGDSGKQIWMTEYGAPTGGPGILETSATDTQFTGSPDHVTEALQAEMISQAMTSTPSYSWAGPLFIYSYEDMGTSTDSNENFFGILNYDGSTKPVYDTIKNLLTD